ncbi:MAG: UDP-N-acetylmuramoyl-L-alanine--D-glutamate ligase [Patescibacteria group bacterium]|nr:UDP-N-acetylmuramoyl-L-alanine--D-glutamate ligase [Patescibacteria group bacterium]
MKIAILGYGKEGQSAFRHWSKSSNEITIHDNDLNKNIPKGVASVLGPDALMGLDNYGYQLLVRSPGLRIQTSSIKTPITTPTNEFLQSCKAPIIGVTGSKGKGTTATLVYKILRQAGITAHLLGNIGTPALDELQNIKSSDVVIYEMSSFQLYDVDSSPQVAVCLMVTQDHLDWHDDLAEYQNSKGNIFKFQKPDNVAIYYADNKVSQQLAQLSAAETKYSYGSTADVCVKDGAIVAFGQKIVNVSDIALPGVHNLQNMCAAIAACWVYTQDIKAIRQVLSTFTGLPYHIELVAERNGIKYYNDSFSANPTSTIAAIKCFTQPQVLFLGGYDKKTQFDDLAEEVSKQDFRAIITYGQTGKNIAKDLSKKNVKNVNYMSGNNFEQIIAAGLLKAQRGDVVVFSPGCSSFDMFSDYIQRGLAFNKIVEGTG